MGCRIRTELHGEKELSPLRFISEKKGILSAYQEIISHPLNNTSVERSVNDGSFHFFEPGDMSALVYEGGDQTGRTDPLLMWYTGAGAGMCCYCFAVGWWTKHENVEIPTFTPVENLWKTG
ncbi:MAG: hypothetical protein ACOX4I_00890 [Anaerovoracaceae bacterium]